MGSPQHRFMVNIARSLPGADPTCQPELELFRTQQNILQPTKLFVVCCNKKREKKGGVKGKKWSPFLIHIARYNNRLLIIKCCLMPIAHSVGRSCLL